jgi:2-amino-4-hydroxy-6-hydroxymethyldihydropteridine diphosphokinase
LATVFVGLGSNLGDRVQNLRKAIKKIDEVDKISIKKVSSVYETSFDPFSLLEHLLAIEDQMGRKREEKWGPRNIDLDLLLYNNRIVDSERLNIPHPRMHERKFVLIPLAQIAPQLLHPLLNKSVEELLESCEDKSMIRLYSEKI